MKYGFSFKGKHTNEFAGLTVKTASRPIKPDMRDAVFTAPYADGSQSTADKNPYGREFYETRQFTVTMFLTADDFTSLNRKLAKISSWLTGSGELIFDDTPLVIWNAKAAGAVDYAPERAGKKAVLSISFEVQPFGHLVWGIGDGPVIGQAGIYLGDNIPIGLDGQNNTVTLTASASSKTLTVLNYGDRYVRPVITIRPAAYAGEVTVSISGSENSMMIDSGSGVKTVVIDCDRHTVTDENGNNIMGRPEGDKVCFSGRFTELPPGKSTLLISRTSGEGNAEVTVDFAPMLMWDANFDDVDWE